MACQPRPHTCLQSLSKSHKYKPDTLQISKLLQNVNVMNQAQHKVPSQLLLYSACFYHSLPGVYFEQKINIVGILMFVLETGDYLAAIAFNSQHFQQHYNTTQLKQTNEKLNFSND